MAKTHFVKSYRGQRTCQWRGDCTICFEPQDAAVHERNEAYEYPAPGGHRFVDPGRCGEPMKKHYRRQNRIGDETNIPGNPDEMVISNHPFTQTPKKCEKCGKQINIGDPYKWVAPRAHRASRGTRKVRCSTCPGWKPSELTSSQHLAQIYAAQEDAEEALSALGNPETPEDTEAFLEELRAIAEQAADTIRGASETYRESADNIEDGFGHATYQSEELADNAQMVSDWADELGYLDFEDFEAEEPVCADCGLPESASEHDNDEDDEEGHDYDEDDTIGNDLEDWAEEQVGVLNDALAESPL